MKPCLPILAVSCLTVSLTSWAQTGAPPSVPPAGIVNVFRTTNTSSNRYTDAPNAATQSWLQTHFWGMLTYSPYFDTRLSWYPNGFAYIDSYAIYTSSPIVTQHPEWILKDAQGNYLYIPWGCSNGTCPQYAADFSNQAFCQWWIGQAQSLVAIGYAGLFVDDVNMDFRVGDGTGASVVPFDVNTGAPMIEENWRYYLAQFMSQVRAAFPNTAIIQNSIWYAGPPGIADQDPNIQTQIAAATYLNIEFGVNDPSLTGGDGQWSLNSLLGYIDRLHAVGKGAILGGVPSGLAGEEYAVANYYLISTGQDAIGSLVTTPANWWNGFGVNLGVPLGPRSNWDGLLRRDYSGGMVLVNPPQSSVITVSLPGTYQSIDTGLQVTSVTLGPAQGALLLSVQ
jgi:putative glycosyl hydrolase-like family 15 (GHL15) protein